MKLFDENISTLKDSKKIMGFLFCTGFIDAVLTVVQAISLAVALTNFWFLAGSNSLYDHYPNPESFVLSQLFWIGLLICSYLMRQLVSYGRNKKMTCYAGEQSSFLRNEVTNKLYALGPSALSKYGSGAITTMIIEGINQVKTYLGLLLPKVADLIIIPVVLTIALFAIDLISGIIAFAMLPVIMVYMRVLGGNAKESAEAQHEQFRRMGNHFIDTVRGISTLQMFGASSSYRDAIFSVSEDFRKATIKTLKAAFLSSLALDVIRTFALAAVAIMLGFRLMNGQMELLPALTCLIIVPEYFAAIKRYAGDFHATLDGKNQLQSILDFLNEEEPEIPTFNPIKPWDSHSKMEVSSLSFHYPNNKQAGLNNINFVVEGYKKIGIIGISGSGKTTLAHVLSGFIQPDCLTLSINGQNAAFTQESWLTQVSYIPQRPHLFHGTIAENVAFYAPSATQEEIEKAIHFVGLDELINELPEGLNTLIGEGGHALSGGQAQRIALARVALNTSRKILIFDEPTAHIDIETEYELKKNMLPLMEDHLVFFATHRLHWAAQMDYLLVLDRGTLVQAGTFDELNRTKGPFKDLANQLRGVGSNLSETSSNLQEINPNSSSKKSDALLSNTDSNRNNNKEDNSNQTQAERQDAHE